MARKIQLFNPTEDLMPFTSASCVSYKGKPLDIILNHLISGSMATEQSLSWRRSTDNETWVDVSLPDSINAIDGQSESYFRGDVYYKTTISPSANKRQWLFFPQASQICTIYISGQPVYVHKGGYTPFVLDITDNLSVGENTISVTVNNERDLQLAPVTSDFNKNNMLQIVKYIETSSIYFSPEYGEDGFHISQITNESSSKITINTSIYNSFASNKNINIIASIVGDDGEMQRYEDSLSVPASGNVSYTKAHTFSSRHLWNGLSDPYLYTVTLAIVDDAGNIIDEKMTKIGLRYYRASSVGFYLNGKPYPLRGVAYHQDMNLRANALTEENIDADFSIIKELGCNFLRVAHYPHNKRVYEWCDKLGIVVQTEIPFVNDCGDLATTEYLDNLKSQLEEMIDNFYNHPSIVFWGLANELGNAAEGQPQGSVVDTNVVIYLNTLYAFAKSKDSERLIGFVTHRDYGATTGYGADIHCDWLGRNLYCGWYVNQSDPSRVTNFMNNNYNAFPYLCLSEYGSGNNPYCHSPSPATTTQKGVGGARHDEEWANYVHETHLQKIYGELSYLLFTSTWILFDFAVAQRREGYQDCEDGETLITDTSKYYINDKGIVTRDRQLKKDVFFLYKAKWNDDPMVYITSRRFTHRPTGSLPIKVYSNCASVSLYVNGTLTETLTSSGEASGVIWSFTPITISGDTEITVRGYSEEDVNVATDMASFSL